MFRILFSLCIVGSFCLPTYGQLDTAVVNAVATAVSAEFHEAQEEVSEAESPFHRQVILSARKLVRDGTMQRRDMVTLRVAMFSPAFRVHAENLAVIQIAASGIESDQVPVGPDGTINRAGINWEGLTAFMEKFIPLLLELLKAFVAISSIDFQLFQDGGAFYANVSIDGNHLMTVA